MPTIVSGDDTLFPVTLTKKGVVVPIGVSASVKAALIGADRATVVIPAATQSRTESGADWPNGVVAIAFSAAETANIDAEGVATLEVQVVEGGVTTTWTGTVDTVIGHIA